MRLIVPVAAACAVAVTLGFSTSGLAASPNKTVVVYDDLENTTPASHSLKWSNPYGLGETATPDADHAVSFVNGVQRVRAVPFRTGLDYSVFDHLKYMEVSNMSFPVPPKGSVEFSADMTATTPGTVDRLVQHGTFTQGGASYQATVLQGQQAGVVLNMVDFCTGQLFDWFLAGSTAFTLIERLPSNVTGNTANPGCSGATYVGRDKMYTQIIDEVKVGPGTHNVSIRYDAKQNSVEYFLDRKMISKVKNVGIPIDKQHEKYTGIYPSLGAGESLVGKIKSFSIGHGLFSLLDAFPYQHPEAPELSVNIPVGSGNPADAGNARLFGQGADGTWDNFIVTTIDKS